MASSGAPVEGSPQGAAKDGASEHLPRFTASYALTPPMQWADYQARDSRPPHRQLVGVIRLGPPPNAEMQTGSDLATPGPDTMARSCRRLCSRRSSHDTRTPDASSRSLTQGKEKRPNGLHVGFGHHEGDRAGALSDRVTPAKLTVEDSLKRGLRHPAVLE